MVFQNLMDKVLGAYRFAFAIAYMDDIIIYSTDIKQHIQHIKLVLQRLKYANLSIKLSKCQWFLPQVEYLGFIISQEGVKGYPEKIKPIIKYPAPTNLQELERFLGMTGVHQRFIAQYQVKTETLRRLKRKDVKFIWTKEQQEAFETLKKDLCLLPTLKQPNFSRPFELHCDAASKAGIAVTLCQRYEDQPYPLSYASRSLTIHEQRYSIQELECLAVIFGIKKHRQYLEHGTFTVFTDHSSLQWVMNTKEDKHARIWRRCKFLQSYEFKVIYIPRRTNHAADALSRHPLPTTINAVEEIKWNEEQQKDNNINKIKQDIQQHPTYTVQNNILYKIRRNNNPHKNKLYIVVHTQKIDEILQHYHDSPFAGHFGYKKTIAKIQQHQLWWPKIEEDVRKHCKQCQLCQQTKGSKTRKYQQGSTTGELPFARVALDFWGTVTADVQGNKYILVCIDTFTRYVELYSLATTSYEEIVKTFFTRFILRHGVPKEIMTDNGPPFLSVFFGQLTKLLGSQNIFTPAYHPQSNGVVERFMSTLRRMILAYTDQETIATTWSHHIRIIQFVYNTTTHSATGHTPFFLTHGRHPRTPLTIFTQPIYDHYQSPTQEFAIQLQHSLNQAFDLVESMKTPP